MKQAVFVLGILGIFVGLMMTLIAMSSRNFNANLAIYGILTAVVSLIVTFVAKIVISQRS